MSCSSTRGMGECVCVCEEGYALDVLYMLAFVAYACCVCACVCLCRPNMSLRSSHTHTRTLAHSLTHASFPSLSPRYIVSASGDKTIKVFKRATGELVHTLRGHTRGIACLHFYKDWIVSGSSDKTIKVCACVCFFVYLNNMHGCRRARDQRRVCVRVCAFWIWGQRLCGLRKHKHTLTHSLTHSLTHALTHSLTRSLTHLFIHSGQSPWR